MQILRSQTAKPKHHLILAHGAGAPMDSEWMNDLATELSVLGVKSYRFEFPYMQERRESGKKRPPNSKKILEETWREVFSQLKIDQFFIGGKSMGGRIASHIVAKTSASGLVCYGFPFYAPGKSLGDRHHPLLESKIPTLILQGERDAMGDKASLSQIKWPKTHQIHYLPDGDHSFKPRKSSGHHFSANIRDAAQQTLKFMDQHS